MANRMGSLRDATDVFPTDDEPRSPKKSPASLADSRIDLRGHLEGVQCPRTRLTYSSVLLVNTDEEARQLMVNVMQCWHSQNTPRHIGGALHLNVATKSIVQIIEGPDAAVRQLYANIRKDKRHFSVNIFSPLMPPMPLTLIYSRTHR